MRKPLDYPEIMYNEAILKTEQEWDRKLTEHERNVLIQGYKIGRTVEAENEIKVIFAN